MCIRALLKDKFNHLNIVVYIHSTSAQASIHILFSGVTELLLASGLNNLRCWDNIKYACFDHAQLPSFADITTSPFPLSAIIFIAMVSVLILVVVSIFIYSKCTGTTQSSSTLKRDIEINESLNPDKHLEQLFQNFVTSNKKQQEISSLHKKNIKSDHIVSKHANTAISSNDNSNPHKSSHKSKKSVKSIDDLIDI